MYVVSSYGELRRLMKEFSLKLRCSERTSVYLAHIELINKAITEARVNGLSVIDAYEDRDHVVVVIENRFKGCYGD